MTSVKKAPRNLFWFTLILIIAVAVLSLTFLQNQATPPITIATKGQPTIGYPNAPVLVIVFEEPKCSHCKRFTEEIYPKLKKNYIDTNKIRFTVIPVSFLPESMPAANALLCVYKQQKQPNNELFFTYLDEIFRQQPETPSDWATTDYLEQIAKEVSPQINLAKLKRCMEHEKFRSQIEKNTEYGNQIMGHLTTPSVFVNGKRVKTISFDAISKKIESALKEKEDNAHENI